LGGGGTLKRSGGARYRERLNFSGPGIRGHNKRGGGSWGKSWVQRIDEGKEI